MKRETIADLLGIIRAYLAIPMYWALYYGGYIK